MKNRKNDCSLGEIENFIKKFNLYEGENFKKFLKNNGFFWWPLVRSSIADEIMVAKKLKWSSRIADKSQKKYFKSILKHIKIISSDFITIFIICFKSIKTIYISSRNIPDLIYSAKANKSNYLIIGNKDVFAGSSYFINMHNIQFLVKILKIFVYIPSELLNDSKKISSELNYIFDTNLDISNMIVNQYKIQIAYSWIWSLMLFMLKQTKKIVFVNDNSQHTLIHQAKEKGIFTVEIQHGYIGNAHEGYTFPNLPFKVSTLPDQIIINREFGENFYPVSQIRSKFSEKSQKISDIYRKRDIDILLGTSPKLIKETKSIIETLKDTNFKIAIKLHPAESIDIYRDYLKDNFKIYLGYEDIKLIAQKSKIYIPVFPLSTSAFEAHKYGCTILTINYNERKLSNILDPIIDSSVNSIKDLPCIISEIINKYWNFEK